MDGAALVSSVWRALQPAAGVRLSWAGEVRVGPSFSSSQPSPLSLRVEDDGWSAAVLQMTRSQYSKWLDEQRDDGRAALADQQQPQQRTEDAPPPAVALPASPRWSSDGFEEKEAVSVSALSSRLAVSVAARRLPARVQRERLSFDSRISIEPAFGDEAAVTRAAAGSSGGPQAAAQPQPVRREKDEQQSAVKQRQAVVRPPVRRRRGQAGEGGGSEQRQRQSQGPRQGQRQQRLQGVLRPADAKRAAAVMQQLQLDER